MHSAGNQLPSDAAAAGLYAEIVCGPQVNRPANRDGTLLADVRPSQYSAEPYLSELPMTDFRTLAAAAFLVGVGFCTVPQAHAVLLGDTISASYQFPNLGSVIQSSGTAIVGSGIEFSDIYPGVTADFADTTLTIEYLSAFSWYFGSQNGPVFIDLTSPFTHASLDVATNVSNFTARDVSVSNGQLILNWEGLSFLQGAEIVLDLADVNQSVPEPATVALLGMSMIALGAVRGRTKQHA
jgi:hypothetical protein